MGGALSVASDLPAITFINLRLVQLIAMSYGYEVNTPKEMMISLKVFHAGTLPKRLQKFKLDELKEKYGVQEEEKGIKKAVSGFFDRKDAFSQIPIKKKTYVRLALFLGAFGGHRFYTKQYPSAILYLLTCWTGYSLAMTMVDLLIAVPKKADENGCIYL